MIAAMIANSTVLVRSLGEQPKCTAGIYFKKTQPNRTVSKARISSSYLTRSRPSKYNPGEYTSLTNIRNRDILMGPLSPTVGFPHAQFVFRERRLRGMETLGHSATNYMEENYASIR